MDQARREFRDVIRSDALDEALPVDASLAEIDAFIDRRNPYRIDKVIAAIGNGSASADAQGAHHRAHSAPVPPSHSAHDRDQRVADARHEPLA
jgi:hypothetical protein